MDIIVKPIESLNGTFCVPGDKSISHRSVMFAAIAEGTSNITGFLTGEDCLSTIECFKHLGVEIDARGTNVTVHGLGLRGLKAPTETLYVGNSGTTLRLLTGLLSGQSFNSNITGDASITKRPMDRVIKPLSQMGANITGENGKTLAPLNINGAKLHGMNYKMTVASAQVKSAILLASLYADTETTIDEGTQTRDHTEIMLNEFGANITRENGLIVSKPIENLKACDIKVPGDISSAAFLIVAATILENSNITIENVNVNPTRTGIITALKQMGANITILNERVVCGELLGDICVKSAQLKATNIGGGIIPKMIDEIPVFAVAAAFAEGTTIISGAEELLVKESNRIKAVHDELKKMDADIQTTPDGLIITGRKTLKGAVIQTHGDHRMAMSMAIAALKAQGETTIFGAECADVSYPEFFNDVRLFS